MTNTPNPEGGDVRLPAPAGFIARPAFGPDGFSKPQGVGTDDAYSADQMRAMYQQGHESGRSCGVGEGDMRSLAGSDEWRARVLGDQPRDAGQRARELLAAEYRTHGWHEDAGRLCMGGDTTSFVEDDSLRVIGRLLDEGDEDTHVITELGRLLAEIAIILKGPEPAGTAWSYHDLPAMVRALSESAGGPLSGKYGEVLAPFVTLMERELHANAGKGDRPGWLAMSPEVALLEIYYHLSKLQKAMKDNDGPHIQEYAADVANMAMMALDICGGLALIEYTAPAQAPGGEGLMKALMDVKATMLSQVKWEPCDCGCPHGVSPANAVSVTWLRAVQQLDIALARAEDKE